MQRWLIEGMDLDSRGVSLKIMIFSKWIMW